MFAYMAKNALSFIDFPLTRKISVAIGPWTPSKAKGQITSDFCCYRQNSL